MDRHQFTITLGRNGQVVNRGRNVSNVAGLESSSAPGSKGFARKRGSDVDNMVFPTNKRQRGDGMKWSRSDNGDFHIGQDDLRLKLMHKSLSKRYAGIVQDRKMDLREKLSRTVVETPARVNMLRHRPEPNSGNLSKQVSAKERENHMLQVDSLRKSYSSRTTDGLRAEYPYKEILRGLQPRKFVEQGQLASMTTADASRNGRALSNDVLDASRPTGSRNITMKTTHGTASPLTHFAATTRIVQRHSYTGEEPPTVASLLHSLGLGKYAILFQAEEVDMTVLKQMGDKDLKELGIPMGPRKKILLALLPRSRRQPP